MAQLTGRSNLLSAEVMNTATMLTEREASFASKIIREGALIGGQIDLDLYTEWVALETMSEVNDIAINAQVNSLETIAVAKILEKREIARIAAESKITSQLVHLLA
ncbi:MAG TPA: hypothetical protein ENH07_07805 [Nitrospirae bacterium]|nr:hypothetical protein [Nitrospirota bacterium]